MEKATEPSSRVREVRPAAEGGDGGVALVNDDVLLNIFGRLPALSFASAACVCKSWKSVCNRILCRPKLASALSLNHNLHVAVKEVLDKILSEPIRPDFAIASVGLEFDLEEIHLLISKALGSKIPIITNVVRGIMGMDALTNEVREVQWRSASEGDPSAPAHNWPSNINRGIVLTVGFVPGLQAHAISMTMPTQETSKPADKFVMDIRNYTASVSGCTSPACIIMFGKQHLDMKLIVRKIDYAMAKETVIVGGTCGRFLCRGRDYSQDYPQHGYFSDVVALVLVRDRARIRGTGEIQFHYMSSTGIIPFGPRLKAEFVQEKYSRITWLSASIEGIQQIIHSQGLLEDIIEEMDIDEDSELFIGARQERNCSTASENLGLATTLSFYKILRGGDDECFIVDGIGISSGDTFLFYHSDSETASSSCVNVLQSLAAFKKDSKSRNQHCSTNDGTNNKAKNEVIGGLIFNSYSRGESYFGCSNVDTSPFSLNFPGIPLAGIFSTGEIGRGPSEPFIQDQDYEEHSLLRSLHVCSTVYLVISYVRPTV